MSLAKRHKSDNGTHSSLIHSSKFTTEHDSNESGRILYSPAVVLEGHTGGPVFSTKFSHDGTKIASSGMDKSILLWNLPSSQHDEQPNYACLTGHKGAVVCANWTHDNSIIVSASADSSVGFWDTTTGNRVRKCTGHEAGSVVNEVDTSCDDIAMSVGDDGSVVFWDQRQRNPVDKIDTELPLLTGKFSHSGTNFFISGIESKILAYDVRVLDKVLWSSEGGGLVSGISSIGISPDDTMLVSRSLDGTVKTYNANQFVPEGVNRMNPYVYEGAPSGKENLLIRTCFSNDNIKIVSGSEDATVTIWDLGTRRIVGKYAGHQGTVIDVAYHPSEPIMVSSSTDGSIIVREV
ncbi:uncharacterized protein J8A68_004931 [[Candida] subhashii]|uniref:Uncharacterized protein n=1 Tax=[Candida] subhashii TaxID=561895 RepID=A0A8J5UJ69_9ASCO|nr:uncharacterized protein J8A68_004931 [[Candida] subhashii]KAG7661562.1 hypothetical protein J8A68_004931 [[Candida] subhashii]